MRILVEHLKNVADTLQKHGQQMGIAKHGDNSGAAREALTKLFLQQHLPASVAYLTGELFDHTDKRSGQIDLIVHPVSSPRLHLIENISLVFNDAALAAIEVKSTLTTASTGSASHLRSALDSCLRIKSMERAYSIKGMKKHGMVELRRTPVIIFAFDGPTVETLREKLWEYQSANKLSLDMLPDIITVLNRGYYLVQNNGWLIDPVPDESVHWSQNIAPEGVLIGMYAYLTQIIEAHGSLPHPMPFHAYLKEIAENA